MTYTITLGDYVSLTSRGYFKRGYEADTDPVEIADEYQVFLAQFGESLTYRPRAGAARTILAVVERDPPERLPDGGMGKVIVIHVANQATAVADDEYGGISLDELDTGGDKVDVPVRVGQTAQTRTIVRLIEQDGGMLALEVR